MAELPPEAGELYALPLGEFIAARDELAKRLRAAGDAAAAAAVKKLRKPPVPAWAINKLARERAPGVQELFAAGARLREAQRALGRGGEARAVQDAAMAERVQVSKLVAAASEMLEAAGHRATVAYQEAMANTLYATTTDADARAAVESARVERDYTRVGFGNMPELAVVPDARGPGGGAPPAGAAEPGAAAAERARKGEARARWKRLAQEATDPQREADRAARDAADAQGAARRAHENAERVQRAADDARARAEQAAAAMKE
jgi:hypothetical protein